ncbi:hypothetical protein P4056_08695 [Pseudomonas aeruginosa]|nr:hypothetical protein [Pseudomonas aeruginosa]
MAEREKELWANELEWQRQNPHPDLSDFHALLDKEIRRQKLIRLPGLDIAMWPEAVDCDIDVSNTEKFNDRFIELPSETRASGFEKWFIGAHNLLLSIILIASFFDHESWRLSLVTYSMVAVIFGRSSTSSHFDLDPKALRGSQIQPPSATCSYR